MSGASNVVKSNERSFPFCSLYRNQFIPSVKIRKETWQRSKSAELACAHLSVRLETLRDITIPCEASGDEADVGRNLSLIEHRALRQLKGAKIDLGGLPLAERRSFPLDEELAMTLGLLFRALAPMRSRDNIRMVAEGIEAMVSSQMAVASPTSPASARCSPLAHPRPTPMAPIRSTGRASSPSRVPAVADARSSSRRSVQEARRNIGPSRRPSTAHDPATALPARHDRSEKPLRPGSTVPERQGRSAIRTRRQQIRPSPPRMRDQDRRVTQASPSVSAAPHSQAPVPAPPIPHRTA